MAPIERLLTIAKDAIALVGGSGGVLYFIDRYRNRTRLTVTIQHEIAGSSPGPLLRFEAENLGGVPMSVVPTIKLTGLDLKLRQRTLTLTMGESERRHLAPHVPTPMLPMGEGDPDGVFGQLWYRRFSRVYVNCR